MHKLTLNPESLRVESFPTVRTDYAAGGTVRGHEGTVYTYDHYQQTCGGLSCQVACRTRYQVTCDTAC